MTKIYIAGNFRYDRNIISELAKVFEDYGYKITCNWFLEEDSLKERIRKAIRDINGVSESDVLIVYMAERDRKYKGAWVEVGCALGLRIPVYFIGPYGDECIFREHPLCQSFNDFPDTELIDAIYKEMDLIHRREEVSNNVLIL